MLNTFKKNSDLIYILIFALLIFFSFRFGFDYFNLPSSKDLVEIFRNFINTYGVPIIFVSAVLESIVLIGNYFPGTIIIFSTLSLTDTNILDIFKLILFTIFGMLIGHNINYFLGKRGVSKIVSKLKLESEIEKIKHNININGLKSIFILFSFPGFASLASLCLGILNYDYKKYLLFLIFSISFWTSIWGGLAYIFGSYILSLITSGYFSFILLAIFMVLYLYANKKS